MKPKAFYSVAMLLALCFSAYFSSAQTIGATASAVWISNCTQSNFYNTSSNNGSAIGPVANVFTNASFGVHTQNSGTLFLNGAEVHTFKNTALATVCNVLLHYRIYKQGITPGAFSSVALPLLDACDAGANSYPTGGGCQPGDQKWNRIMNDGDAAPFTPIDLTAFSSGNYVLEVYYEIAGSSVSTILCNENILLNNGGNNYKASFTIQSPFLSSANPITCNGSEGKITISGLAPAVTYTLNYADDGVPVGPLSVTANSNGEVLINGLNAGLYSDFILQVNGCTTEFNADIVLSGAVITPRFNAIASFCAGATAPALQATSNNGINGTWSPATINNQTSGTYTFTPAPGQCSKNVTLNVVVKPNIVPTFSFGTSLSICAGQPVPSLPAMSVNSIRGTWSPGTINNSTSGSYTFTPDIGQCAVSTTLSVTVNPNITPVFTFGTALNFCAGDAVPSLPSVSANGINGTWNAPAISNSASATYVFTPAAGVCANTASLSVTITPNVTPVFNFGNSMTLCSGDNAPVLPYTSVNGVTGTWNPATINNSASATYIFTADPGQCSSNSSLSVVVNNKTVPTFSFGNSLTICANASVPALPTTSVNGISGSWDPQVVDATMSGTYTFTPATGQCATQAVFEVTVNPNITPAFTFGTSLNICSGAAVPALPATSSNGISGTWNPTSINAQSSGTYTFTPSSGQCANAASLTVTVQSNQVPVFGFGTSLSICSGGVVPTLPSTSANSITGTWSPATVSNTQSGTYTFTPDNGQCASLVTFTVTVSENIRPAFSIGTALTICAGQAVPVLPSISSNGISGQWSPATVDNQASGNYTFTPDPGQCALQGSFAVTVNQNVKPVFAFGTAITICNGDAAPFLSNVSTNSINGTWSPSVIDNKNNGTYTFTPAAGECAEPVTISVVVNDIIVPSFSFGSSLSICSGGSVPLLPTTDDNGISGSWNKSTVDNTQSATYVFSPDPLQYRCFVTAGFAVTVAPIRTPDFAFGTSLSVCSGSPVPQLATTSPNGVKGSWSPSEIDNRVSATYTFTPDAGECATGTTLRVTVNENVVPSFQFGSSTTICFGATVPILPELSTNGIEGTWSPATVDNQTSGSYTFTPKAGQCALSTSFSVTVLPNIEPLFDFGKVLNICVGNSVPVLPSTSNNGIDGVWSPGTIDKLNSAIYTFTPQVLPGQCIVPVTLEVIIQPRAVPTFSFGTATAICAGSAVPVLPAISINGIAGKWTPDKVDNTTSATYIFNPTSGQCSVPEVTFSVTVNPLPAFTNTFRDTTITDGAILPVLAVSSSLDNVTYSWSNTNTNIGLAAAGLGTVPSFTAINKGATPINGTISIVPVSKDGCKGVAGKYIITVLPLSKDVFVPNVFSPNGDGKNDVLMVYGNYISSIQMRIFNQWGQQVAFIDQPSKSWDGTYKGKQSAVGVYVYAYEVILRDGKTVKGKGNITLIR